MKFLSFNMWFSRNVVFTAYASASVVLVRHPHKIFKET
jgi:hypothetical protein